MYTFLSLDDLTRLPPPEWYITHFFEAGKIVMVAGPPGSGKSFLALDWMLSSATGRDWCGHPVKHAKVLYILGEGHTGLLKRVRAWQADRDLTPEEQVKLNENFRVCFDPVVQMADPSSVSNLLAEFATVGFVPELICLDTLARTFLGKDENSSKDAGEWVQQAERLRRAGHTVLFIHHTRKPSPQGGPHVERGSGAFLGAIDSAFIMYPNKKHKVRCLKCTKQKEHEEPTTLFFSEKILFIPELGDDSLVLRPTSLTAADVGEEDEDGDPTDMGEPVPQERFVPPSDAVIAEVIQLVLEDGTITGENQRIRTLEQELKSKGITKSFGQCRYLLQRAAADHLALTPA